MKTITKETNPAIFSLIFEWLIQEYSVEDAIQQLNEATIEELVDGLIKITYANKVYDFVTIKSKTTFEVVQLAESEIKPDLAAINFLVKDKSTDEIYRWVDTSKRNPSESGYYTVQRAGDPGGRTYPTSFYWYTETQKWSSGGTLYWLEKITVENIKI